MLLTFGDGKVEILWVRIRGQTNNADVIAGVYYGLPSQDEDTDKLFFKEQREISKSTALVLLEDFMCWMFFTGNTTQLEQNQKTLKTHG